MNRRFIQQATFVLVLILLTLFLWFARHVLLLAFTGLLLALALTSAANWTRRLLPISHRWALLIVIILLLGAVVLGAKLLAPALSEQFATLAEKLPQQIQQIQQSIEKTKWYPKVKHILPEASSFTPSTGSSVAGVSKIFVSTADALSGMFLILFLAIFLAVNPPLYKRGVLALVPARRRARAVEILTRVICSLKFWLLGQLIAMVVVGVIVGVSLGVAGIPLAIAIGVLAGLFEFIPFLGPMLSAIPAILLASSEGPEKILIVIGIFAVVQMIEGNLLMPLVQHKTVDLPPVITLLAVVLFGTAFGFIGVLVATPLAAVVMVLVQELYICEYLGERIEK